MFLSKIPVLLLLLCHGGSALASAPVLNHDLSIRIDAASRSFLAHARVSMDPDAGALPNLSLGDHWEVTSLHVDGRPASLPRTGRLEIAGGASTLEIVYRGAIGVDSWPYLLWLPGEGWYPEAPGHHHRFRLHADLPQGWSALTQGVPRETATGGFSWTQDDAQQGIYLVAGPWRLYQQQRNGLHAAVMLLDDGPELAKAYLDAALHWMARYARMLGEYPYHGFTLVENRLQTGWGMPGFTLLGSRVIRLPFIVDSSFPHEILHNWWGNGVFVDPTQGNWSEGLTTYLSDHLIRESRGEGRQYRLDTLIAWHDFAAGGNDFPLARFRGRHDKATQAVGYGKGMFLFHMLRAELGEEAFFDGLRGLYRTFRFTSAGFDDVRRMFERACQCSLEAFFAQWLLREGVPGLFLEHAEVVSTQHADSLTFTLRQSGEQPWRLLVPLRITRRDGQVLDVSVALESLEQSYTLEFDHPPARLEVDPDHDLFRQLHGAERPVTFSRIFAATRVAVIPADEDFAEAARAMAMSRPQWRAASVDERPEEDVLVMIGRTIPPPAHGWSPDVRRYRLEEGHFLLDGERNSDHAERVIALADTVASDDGVKTVLWLAGASGERLIEAMGRLVHYGRRSYVVLGGDRDGAPLTGQWRGSSQSLARDFGDKIYPSP